MQLTDDDIREFIELWKQEFDEVLTSAQAREEATRLLELAMLLARTPPPDVPKKTKSNPTP